MLATATFFANKSSILSRRSDAPRPTRHWDTSRQASRVPMATYRLTAEGIIVPGIPERPLQLSFDDLTA